MILGCEAMEVRSETSVVPEAALRERPEIAAAVTA
jgi:hypothetical protein